MWEECPVFEETFGIFFVGKTTTTTIRVDFRCENR